MYVLLYLKWITSKVLLYSTEDSVQCEGAAWRGGEYGREWLRPIAVHLKLSQLC